MFRPHLLKHIKAPTSRRIYIENNQVPALMTHEIKRLLRVACFSGCIPWNSFVKCSFET
jgi:hypothetical protein